MSLLSVVSVSGIPVASVLALASKVPWGFDLPPGVLLPELARLSVPLDGEPGRGHGVEVGLEVPGVLGSGGAEVDLFGGVEESWWASSRGRGTRPPK